MPRQQPARDPNDPVLRYVGDGGAHVGGVPARDLTGYDLARLARARDSEPEAVAAELIATGLYAPASEG
jgi:hypothetical protein